MLLFLSTSRTSKNATTSMCVALGKTESVVRLSGNPNSSGKARNLTVRSKNDRHHDTWSRAVLGWHSWHVLRSLIWSYASQAFGLTWNNK